MWDYLAFGLPVVTLGLSRYLDRRRIKRVQRVIDADRARMTTGKV